MKSGIKKTSVGKNNGKGNKSSSNNNNTPKVPHESVDTIHSIEKEPVNIDISSTTTNPSLVELSKTDPTMDAASIKQLAEAMMMEDSKEEIVSKSVPPIINFSTFANITPEEEGLADGATSWRDVDSPIKKAIDREQYAALNDSSNEVKNEKTESCDLKSGFQMESVSHKTASTCMSDLTSAIQPPTNEFSFFQLMKSVILSLFGQIVASIVDSVRVVVGFYQRLVIQSSTTVRELLQTAISWYICTMIWLITLPYLLVVDALTLGLRVTVSAVNYFFTQTTGVRKGSTVGGCNSSTASTANTAFSGTLTQ